MNPKRKTDQELAPLLEHFAERSNRVFAYFFCALEYADEEGAFDETGRSDRVWVVQTILNACLDSSLLALRDLDDFFNAKPKMDPDDLKASDFGYFNGHKFLTVDERKRINKLIAHTTIFGAQECRFRWKIWKLVSKCLPQISAFLKWVEDHYGFSYFHLYTAALACRTRTQQISDHVATEIAKSKRSKV